jgi:hypothetical protein
MKLIKAVPTLISVFFNVAIGAYLVARIKPDGEKRCANTSKH